jgi:tRNA wybutosine-synthesizing protein 2
VCFELNPWSIEGLRRGVIGNNWSYTILDPQSSTNPANPAPHVDDVDFIISPTSNTHAVSLISTLTALSPIRHVNLGLLPRSRDSWADAVALVDTKMGGWIRAHENVGECEMEKRKGEVEQVFQGYLNDDRRAKIVHVERVKMYAPGVVHCVFDVWIDGITMQSV